MESSNILSAFSSPTAYVEDGYIFQCETREKKDGKSYFRPFIRIGEYVRLYHGLKLYLDLRNKMQSYLNIAGSS